MDCTPLPPTPAPALVGAAAAGGVGPKPADEEGEIAPADSEWIHPGGAAAQPLEGADAAALLPGLEPVGALEEPAEAGLPAPEAALAPVAAPAPAPAAA